MRGEGDDIDVGPMSKESPLVPKTVAGATMVAIPLTALLTGAGWLGQKVLDLDERVVAVAEQQKDDEETNRKVAELHAQVTGIEGRLERRGKTIDLVHEMDERLNRLEAHFEDLKAEVERIRND